MNKELADIQDLKSAFISHCRALGCEDNYIKVCENKFKKIETVLKEYKNVEDELGIEWIILFKALTNDVYLYHNKKLIKCEQAPCLLCFDNEYCLEFHFEHDIEQVYLKDYGKTWALTREELK